MTTAILRLALLISAIGLPQIPAQRHAGGGTLHFEGSENRPGTDIHIVFIAGDEEYRSEESCPMLAKILSRRYGFETTVLFPINPDGGFIDPQFQKNIPGMGAVADADLVVIGTRFRDLPDGQMQPLANHLNAGKPIIGFRTATHAFKTASKAGGINWNRFGPEILGEGWVNHYGTHKKQGARGAISEEHGDHPILNGVGPIFAESDVYGINRVTEKNADILVYGVVTDTLERGSPDTPEKEPQPAAWLRTYTTPGGGKGTAFATTFGASSDFDDPNLRRLVVNAAFFLVDLEVPRKAEVSYVGPFVPSTYTNNGSSEYYRALDLRPADYAYGKAPKTGPDLHTFIPRRIDSRPNAAEGLPGPAIRSTLTTVEEQQKDAVRPDYEQPKDLPGAPPATALPLTPSKGGSIVFLGNALAARMEHFHHFETLLHSTFPGAELTFRNMGFPAHTPGFRPESGLSDPWAFPGAQRFRPEINAHNGDGHYPRPDEWLTILDADTIVAFFGFNESFDGRGGVANFKAELATFVDHTLARSYNRDTPPQLVLATPIATQQHPGYVLPDAAARNAILKLYAEAVKEVAKEKHVGFIDLFTPSSRWFAEPRDPPLTTNGIHLSDAGYRELAPVLMSGLFGKNATLDSTAPDLRRAIAEKAWCWRHDYRMLNGVHAYGQRWAPYGNFNYPEEIEKIRQMTVLRDRKIWAAAQGKPHPPAADDSQTRPLSPVTTNYAPSAKTGELKFLPEKEALEKFTLPEGYAVAAFATEKEFPNLGNPCQIRFDNHGRLWVSTVKSYPHYRPGDTPPNDMLLIYEDTDGDGRADKETVFAEHLHLPLGFDFAPGGGVFISEEPFLTLHTDTDGDGKADHKEYLLDGLDTHDTHHAISAFDTDNGGGLFMCEGRFLHSQVETPWGTQRTADGGVWRFDPASWKVERVFQSDVSNPWGVAHDEFGQNILNDASGGKHLWMLGYGIKVPHAYEIPLVSKFNYEHHVRPTSGNEFIHSRHFPDDVQGDYIFANTIGFLGIKQFQVVEDGTEIKGKHRQNLIASTDGNFRPCDMEFAPDGSLYFVDWHNTLIGHMQHSARDPLRNSDYGRIYRITCPGRDLVEPPEIAGATVAQLLENMKLPELNARKRSHRELRNRDAAKVSAAALDFASANEDDERLVLEALWATWGQRQPSTALLGKCLGASDHRVRSAALRVVRHSLHLLENPATLIKSQTADPHPRVRLEALSAGSWLGGSDGAEILLQVASQETDKWIRNSLNAAILLLKDEAASLLDDGTFNRADIADVDKLLASKLQAAPKRPPVMTPEVARTKGKKKGFLKQYKLGAEVYFEEGSCSTCHLESGLGVQNIYPPIAKSQWATGDKERLIKLVLHGLWGDIEVNGVTYEQAKGVPPMTALGGMFTDTEIAAVLTYVRSSWGNNAPPITPDEVAAVRTTTKDQKTFYTPAELLEAHPMKK